MKTKGEQKYETEQERLCQLLTAQSEDLREEIIAFFETEKKRRKTIWERVREIFKIGRKIRKRKDDADEK